MSGPADPRRYSLFGGWTQTTLPDGRMAPRQMLPRPSIRGVLGVDAMGPVSREDWFARSAWKNPADYDRIMEAMRAGRIPGVGRTGIDAGRYSAQSHATMPSRSNPKRPAMPGQNIAATGDLNRSAGSSSGAAGKEKWALSPAGVNMLFGSEKYKAGVYHPTSGSGVTLGYGYDLGSRSKDAVIADLTAVGVERNTAEKIAEGAKLTGRRADKFVQNNGNTQVLTEDQAI